MSVNVVLVVLDTMRRDYASLGGLERLGFASLKAIAPSPWTTPSHMSMLSGLYPSEHGVHESPTRKMAGTRYNCRRAVVANTLRARGYRLALLSANPMVSGAFGLKCFDVAYYVFMPIYPEVLSEEEYAYVAGLREEGYRGARLALKLLSNGRPGLALKLILAKPFKVVAKWYNIHVRGYPLDKGGGILASRLLRFLEGCGGGGCFALLNVMEMHEPYKLSPGHMDLRYLLFKAPSGVVEEWREGYGRAAERVRGIVNRLVAGLEERGRLGDTAVIITSDHGQLLGEMDRLGHGTHLHPALLEVPLYIYTPWGLREPPCQFISLRRIADIILQAASRPGEPLRLDMLCEDYAFAEAYSTHARLPPDLSREEAELARRLYDHHRIAVYDGEELYIYNASQRRFEHKEPPPRVAKAAGRTISRLILSERARRAGRRLRRPSPQP